MILFRGFAYGEDQTRIYKHLDLYLPDFERNSNKDEHAHSCSAVDGKQATRLVMLVYNVVRALLQSIDYLVASWTFCWAMVFLHRQQCANWCPLLTMWLQNTMRSEMYIESCLHIYHAVHLSEHIINNAIVVSRWSSSNLSGIVRKFARTQYRPPLCPLFSMAVVYEASHVHRRVFSMCGLSTGMW